ncbi:hypothetical protein F4802DRAFT_48203 [Xylaria palmicola]|nr:hypothetical protein F4802DRAFT_48203 [Xylaria palmicola]
MDANVRGNGGYSPNGGNPRGLETKSESFHQFDTSAALDLHPDWLNDPDLLHPFRDRATPASVLERDCMFRCEVLDECYQSRFWGRALEFYLLDNVPHSPPYRCPMASCPQRDFKDVREMLRHLKHCKLFSQGRFWCPTCNRDESFKVVSKKKCSWDKVNLARKLFQRSWKTLQSLTGQRQRAHPALTGPLCAKCSCSVSGLDPPMPPAGFGIKFQQAEQTKYVAEQWELPTGEFPAELCDTALHSNGIGNNELSHTHLHLPETPTYQTSPSELYSISMGRSGYSTDVSPTSTTLTNDSSMTGHVHTSKSLAIFTPETLSVGQTNRRGETPSLALDTRQSAVNMPVTQWGFNMLLDEDEILAPTAGIDGRGMVDLTPILIAPEPREILPTAVHDESLMQIDNSPLHPSPCLSVPSLSNWELSPSSVSSAPELQCHHSGCEFRPSGKGENLQAYMRKHMKKHEKREIPCEHCHKKYTRQDNLTSHVRRAHSDVEEGESKRRRSSSSDNLQVSGPKRKASRREAAGLV